MAHELAVMESGGVGVSLWRPPEEVLAEAKQAATALMSVVESKKNKVKFNNETYLEFEDWQTVAKFYGCTSKVISTNYVEYGGVTGFEAVAVVLDRNQNEIGRAESMCLSDEDNWGEVPVYEWKDELDANGKKIWVEPKNGKKGFYKGKREQIGTKPKPLFQLKSMAQTRAGAKALRSVFSWVVVLAGYKPSVAEEMTGNEFSQDHEDQRQQVSEPRPTTVDVSGDIKSRTMKQDGTLWLSLGIEHPAVIQAEHAGAFPFAVGDKLAGKAILKKGKTIDFLVIQSVTSYTPAGQVKQQSAEVQAAEDAATEAVMGEGEYVDEAPKGNGKKLGRSQEVRLYTIMTNNAKRTGLTREIIHRILDQFPGKPAHLSDCNYDMLPQLEAIMNGTQDWKPLLED